LFWFWFWVFLKTKTNANSTKKLIVEIEWKHVESKKNLFGNWMKTYLELNENLFGKANKTQKLKFMNEWMSDEKEKNTFGENIMKRGEKRKKANKHNNSKN